MAKKSWSKKLTDGAKNQVVKTVIPKGVRKAYKSLKKYRKTKAQKEIDHFRRQVSKADLKNTAIKTPNIVMRFINDVDSSFDERFKRAQARGPKYLDKFLVGLKKPEDIRQGLVYSKDSPIVANAMLENTKVNTNHNHLLTLSQSRNPIVQKLVLEVTPLSGEIIENIMKSPEARVYALAHSDCPNKYLVVTKESTPDERTSIYSNSKTSPEFLAGVNPLNYADAVGMAQNPKISEEMAIEIRLEWQDDKLINLAFAKNKGLSKSFKAELDYHNNRSLLMELITQGVEVALDDIRIFRDEAMVCVLAASSLLNRFYEQQILKFKSPLAIATMAMNPLTSEFTQRKIYQLGEFNEELALNKNLAPDLSLCLQKNGDEDVKINLATAGHITIETENENGETAPLDITEFKKTENRTPNKTVMFGGCKCRVCNYPLLEGDIGPVCAGKK